MQMMVLILFLTLTVQNKGQLNYDKMSDETHASTPALEIKLKKEDYVTKSLEFNIQYAYQGTRQRPELVKLVFRTCSHRWRFLEEPNRLGVVLFQGRRVDLSLTPAYTSVIGKKYLEETLIYQISFSDLEQLVKAPYVDVRIGVLEGRITEKQLSKTKEALMEFLAGNNK